MLDQEKRLVEQELQTYIDHLESKDKASTKEIQDLRNMSLFLVNTIEEWEQVLSKEVETMRQEISNLQIGFDSWEKSFILETRQYTDKIKTLHNLLTKA